MLQFTALSTDWSSVMSCWCWLVYRQCNRLSDTAKVRLISTVSLLYKMTNRLFLLNSINQSTVSIEFQGQINCLCWVRACACALGSAADVWVVCTVEVKCPSWRHRLTLRRLVASSAGTWSMMIVPVEHSPVNVISREWCHVVAD